MTDKQAFERIFREHYDGMFRLAMRMLGNEAESKDVVSDVFAQLLNSRTHLKDETLHAFLLTYVRNRCVNLLVHRQKKQAVFMNLKATASELDNSDHSFKNERLDALHRYIDEQLPRLSQQVMRLRYGQGLKYREIAETLKVSEVTVHNHLSRSLKQIKNHFKTKGYEF